jgi:hypothetical protein
MIRPLFIAALAAAASTALPAAVAAQDLSGAWRSTRDDVEVTVREWGPGCGPRPSSRRGGIGREATVRATAASLSVDIGGRTLRSDRCWSDNRDVAVRSASHPSPTRWVSTCSTPEGAALAEHGTYTASAEGDRRLTLRDATEYEWNIQGSVCRASSVMMREYERTGPAPAPTPTPTPVPTPTPSPTPSPTPTPRPPVVRRCTQVGPPHSLVIAPSRRSLPVGGRTCFRARVLDVARCDVEGAAVVWSSRPTGGAPELTMERGCVASTRGEGAVELVATAGALSARAIATIVSEDQFRSLAAAQIEADDASVEGVEPGAGQSLGVSVTTEAPSARWSWLAPALALLGGALGLALLGWIALRRKQPRARQEESEPPTVKRPAVAATPESAPRHRREAAPVEVYTPVVDPRSEARFVGAPVDAAVPTVVAKRCPVCAKGFSDATVFCTEDGAALVAASASAGALPAPAPAVAPPRSRVCPRCQRRYEPLMDFCVDDGERLKDG